MADNKFNLDCPACGKQMTKLYMEEAGVNIDICLEGCGGIYFDNRELEKFNDSNEKIDEILNAIEGKHFEPTEDKEIRICSVCGIPMTKMGAANGEVQIDVCNSCGAKFLDNGELQKIRESVDKPNAKADMLMDIMYEENMRNITKISPNKSLFREKRRAFFENLAKRFI